MASREEVADALFNLVCGVYWGNPPSSWAYTSQRLQHWDDCPAQPALYLQEGDERFTHTTRLEAIRVWEYKLVIYQNAAKDDTNPRPASVNNQILEALEKVLGPDQAGNHQTLQGIVHSVKIVGTVLKDDGSMDGQGVIGVPIEVMVP